jgi:hypothetical protein
MDLRETEARNDCADEGQQQLNRPSETRAGVCVCVCVCGEEGQSVNECPLESPPPPVEEK